MAKFCTGCGKELPEGMMFCTECGTKVAEAPASPPPPPPPQQQTAPPPPPPPPPPTQSAYAAPPQAQVIDERYAPVKTSYFFWMQLVFALPLIGWIICLICAFAPKNESKRHFARAILIWALVGIAISIIFAIITAAFGGMLGGYLGDIESYASMMQ